MFFKTKMLPALCCAILFALQTNAQTVTTTTPVTTLTNPLEVMTVKHTLPTTSTTTTNTGIGITLNRINTTSNTGSSLQGVRAETTFDVTNTNQKGSTIAQLATSAGFMATGGFTGVSGEAKPAKLKTATSGSTSYALGGNFVLNAQNLTLATSTGKYLIAGSASTLQGTISNYPINSIYAAVVGRDLINHAINTWAGYFEGRGYFSGRVGIGKKDPAVELHVQGTGPSIWLSSTAGSSVQLGVAGSAGGYSTFAATGDAVMRPLGPNKRLILSTASSLNNGREIVFASNDHRIMSVRDNRKVTIGTENMPTVLGQNNLSSYKLFVSGGIITEELLVQTGWADYVFAPTYRLAPLTEVEQFIARNGHLPNTPSAAEIETGGLNVGKAIVLQQEKIEEIYLHLIALEKEVKKLKAENEALKAKR